MAGITINDTRTVTVEKLSIQPDTPLSPPKIFGDASSRPSVPQAPKVYLGVSDEQGPRSHMEDRHVLIRDFRLNEGDPTARSFFAVYDGHSSYIGSEHARRRLHEIIASQPAVRQCRGQGEVENGAMEEALKAAFEAVDDEIIGVAERKGKSYGTTAVSALLVGRVLWVAHCGDSRAVLYRQGAAVPLTRDHKPSSDAEERARIEAQGGEIEHATDYVISNDGKRRLNMSRALGDPKHKHPLPFVIPEPDVSRIPLSPGMDQILILGSDGLFDVIGDGEIGRIAMRAMATSRQGGDGAATAAADALVAEALRRGTNDNVTALVVVFDWK